MIAKTISLPDLLQASDDSLAHAAAHDNTAFAELYHRHLGRVYRYHMAHTGQTPDAQDLTTQTFLAALEGIGGYRGSGSFGAWLLGIARRQVAMHFRARRPGVTLETAEALPDPAPLPETIIGRRLQLAQVQRALRRLTDEQSSAITLCIFGELSAAEAGQVMGKSEAAIKMLLLRGLKDLRRHLSVAHAEEK